VTGYHGPRRRVLVVDDQLDNRRILRELLVPLGFDVIEAANGAETLELAASHAPDIAFIDLVMPVIDGFEAIRRLRADTASAALPVVAISASAFDSTRAQCKRSGFDDFLTKPVQLDEVLRLIGRHLGLQWVFAKALVAPEESFASGRTTACLPRPLVQELLALARMGDVQALSVGIEAAHGTHPGCSALLTQLAALARSYDMRAVRELLGADLATGEVAE